MQGIVQFSLIRTRLHAAGSNALCGTFVADKKTRYLAISSDFLQTPRILTFADLEEPLDHYRYRPIPSSTSGLHDLIVPLFASCRCALLLIAVDSQAGRCGASDIPSKYAQSSAYPIHAAATCTIDNS
jgi:hypothetical protein